MARIDFGKLMSAPARAMHDAKTAEIDRLYALPDRWLARELVTLARYVRSCEPQYCVMNRGHATLLFECIPEIASRLGETSFQSCERSAGFRSMDGGRLREATAALLSPDRVLNKRMAAVPVRNINVYSLLFNDPCNGSPIAFGLDRIASPDFGCPDPIAAEVYFVADRRGHAADFEWRPEFAIDALPEDWYAAPEVRV